MKKYILLAMTSMVIAGLVISSTASIPVNVSQDRSTTIKNNKADVKKLNLVGQCLSTQNSKIGCSFSPVTMLDSHAAFDDPGNQTHPAIVQSNDGVLVGAYRDEYIDSVLVSYSTDDGQNWAAPYCSNPGWGYDYPSGELWEGSRWFGLAQCPPDLYGGALINLIEGNDATNYSTWIGRGWVDFYDLGWHDMIDSDLACDSSQNEWEWGVNSYVMSTTYEKGYTNGPTIIVSDPDIPWTIWICWWYKNNTAHCHVDIDRSTHIVYAVYDWYNDTAEQWELLVWTMDFADPVNVSLWDIYEIKGSGNLRYPAVAVYDDNLVILAETDEKGNTDIICYYSDEGMNNLQTGYVTDMIDDERYPDIRHVGGDDFVGTFVKNGNLYSLWTKNGGGFWTEPWQINENDGAVVEEYKTSDLCENASKVVWEEYGDEDIDLWIDDAQPPVPELEIGNVTGGLFKIKAIIKNTGDAEAIGVNWSIKLNGGLILLGQETTGTEIISAGGEIEVSSKLIIGFGKTVVTVAVEVPYVTLDAKDVDAFILLFFTVMK